MTSLKDTEPETMTPEERHQEKATILVVDDEPTVLQVVSEMLEGPEYRVIATSDPDEALRLIETELLDVIVTDLVMGHIEGVDILTAANRCGSDAVIILMTGQPSIENAVNILRLGAYDYLAKPFTTETLRSTVERGLNKLRLERENIRLKETVSLYQISEAMSTTSDLDHLLNLILETAVKEFKADMGAILLIDEQTGGFKLKASKGMSRRQLELAGWSDQPSDTNPLVQPATAVGRAAAPFTLAGPTALTPPRLDKKLDFVKSSISQPLYAQGNLYGVVHLMRSRNSRPFTPGQSASLSILTSKAAMAIRNSKLYSDLHNTYLSTITALANAIETRDATTGGHTERVWNLAFAIAKQIDWPPERYQELQMGAVLHDIGKIGVPDAILNKPGPLTEEEFAIMKKHPAIGAKMVEGIPFLAPALPYILYHHERYDGRGYPYGLIGKEIPIEGKLLAVVDTLDAITSDRPYRRGQPMETAMDELVRNSGSQFDPSVVEAARDAYERGLLTPRHDSKLLAVPM